MRRSMLIVGVIAGIAAIAPFPAFGLDLEPYVFAGYRDGSLSFPTGIVCIAIVGVDCPVAASTDGGDDGAWGLGAAVRMRGPWWFDLRWSRQDTEARFLDPFGEVIRIPATPLDISHLHAGVLYRFFDGRRWSPFVTAFGGIAQIDSETGTSQRAEIDLNRWSAGLGGGVLVDLGSRVGLRFELRGSWTDLPAEFDGNLEQLEGSAGLRLRL